MIANTSYTYEDFILMINKYKRTIMDITLKHIKLNTIGDKLYINRYITAKRILDTLINYLPPIVINCSISKNTTELYVLGLDSTVYWKYNNSIVISDNIFPKGTIATISNNKIYFNKLPLISEDTSIQTQLILYKNYYSIEDAVKIKDILNDILFMNEDHSMYINFVATENPSYFTVGISQIGNDQII
jgi:hypothetical protein